MGGDSQNALENLQWLHQNMPPYFFITMRDEKRALKNLAWTMSQLPVNAAWFWTISRIN